MKTTTLISLILTLSSGAANASDITKDIRSGGAADREDGGYFEIGLGAGYSKSALVSDREDQDFSAGITLAGEYSYKGLFIELAHNTYDGLNLGYNALNTQNWSFDILASSLAGNITSYDEDNEIDKNKALINRDTLYNGAGIRATRYWDDTIFQYRLVTDIIDDNGIRSTARLGHSWQLKNWTLHGIASADYRSKKTNQYLLGVTAKEATERFPSYTADAGLSFSAEAGVTYPVTENVVWRASAMALLLSDEDAKSPLVEDDLATRVSTSISYVF